MAIRKLLGAAAVLTVVAGAAHAQSAEPEAPAAAPQAQVAETQPQGATPEAQAAEAPVQSAEAQIRSQLESQGFGDIEIAEADGRIAVQARRGSQRINLTYNATTGALLDDGTGASAGESSSIGSNADQQQQPELQQQM